MPRRRPLAEGYRIMRADSENMEDAEELWPLLGERMPSSSADGKEMGVCVCFPTLRNRHSATKKIFKNPIRFIIFFCGWEFLDSPAHLPTAALGSRDKIRIPKV